MRSLGLYYVYDNINECAITNIIPAANDLVAAIGFRDSFIKCKDKKPYTAYDLVRFGTVNVDEDGQFFIAETQSEIIRYIGREIMNYIKVEYQKLEIDDDMLDDKQEV